MLAIKPTSRRKITTSSNYIAPAMMRRIRSRTIASSIQIAVAIKPEKLLFPNISILPKIISRSVLKAVRNTRVHLIIISTILVHPVWPLRLANLNSFMATSLLTKFAGVKLHVRNNSPNSPLVNPSMSRLCYCLRNPAIMPSQTETLSSRYCQNLHPFHPATALQLRRFIHTIKKIPASNSLNYSIPHQNQSR